MNKFKIIYLHQHFATPLTSGSTRSWEFCTRLIRDNFQVSMICGYSRIADLPQNKILELFGENQRNFHLNPVPLRYSNNMSYLQRILIFISFAIISAFKILIEPKTNLTFATSTPLTIVIPALLRKWLRGTPYIFEVRDLWPELPIAVQAIRSPPIIFLARQLERIAYQNASYIIALSPGMKEGIIKQGISPEKVEVIPNACDNERFNVQESVGLDFITKHPELANSLLIIYAGTLGYINGVHYLAQVASHMTELMPQVKFLVVGSGSCEAEIREASQQLGVLNKNFWMWPSIPKAEMPALLSACTVATSLFLPLPEMENNSANKFFDALAASRPVVINYGGWQKEILETSGAGISIPGEDPQKAAVLLTQFLRDSHRLQTARAAARKLADTEFDRELLYSKLVKVFQNVLKREKVAARS